MEMSLVALLAGVKRDDGCEYVGEPALHPGVRCKRLGVPSTLCPIRLPPKHNGVKGKRGPFALRLAAMI